MINENDKILLKFLVKNSRDTLTEMSRKANIPISEVFDRLKRLNTKLGLKYTVLITKPENL